jgi:hypothetical protein
MTWEVVCQNLKRDDFYLLPLAQKIKFYPSLNLRDLFLSELHSLAVAESAALFAAVFFCLIEFQNSEIIFLVINRAWQKHYRFLLPLKKNVTEHTSDACGSPQKQHFLNSSRHSTGNTCSYISSPKS